MIVEYLSVPERYRRQKKVKAGKIGCSPLRCGPKGNIPELHYKNLCAAYESFVTINQINGNMQIHSAKSIDLLYLRLFMVITRDVVQTGVNC